METLSCHSNQSSYPTEIKNRVDVNGEVKLFVKIQKTKKNIFFLGGGGGRVGVGGSGWM